MPIQLAQALAETYAAWRDELPAAWYGLTNDVDLDGGIVDSKLQLPPWLPIFPPLRNQEPVLGAPRYAETFRAFRGIRPHEVRVVIVGQDPYPDVSKATGLSFEQGNIKDWVKDARLVSRSLCRIIQSAAATEADDTLYTGAGGWRSVVRDIESGTLQARTPTEFFEDTREQGVLWLNTTLSISLFRGDGIYDHQRGHRDFWEPLVSAVLNYLASREEPVVFVLWGGWAKKMRRGLEQAAETAATQDSLAFVEAAHPAIPQFLKSNTLRAVNDELVRLAEDPVDWL